jgi:Tfp pilus assembly protein PilE
MARRRQRHSSNARGFTLSETLTALVALIVLGAVVVTMWRVHELRSRRGDAIEALLALQTAQDQFFGTHARYANEGELTTDPPAGLGIKPTSRHGHFDISILNSDDDLGYWAIARAVAREEQAADTRCVELRLDQNGRRFAVDAEGADKSADCWR